MLTSQLEIIKQGQNYLNVLINKNSNEDYGKVFSPLFISSAGAHMRHIIDHYLALIAGLQSGKVDYDVRHRNAKVEQDPTLALEKLTQISCWLKSLSGSDLTRVLTLSTEISVHEQKVQSVPTSLARELVFTGSHAVHHYAMIAQIAQQQKMVLPSSFGIAPATATYLRKTIKSA
ncbi:MAG: hypothetical protein ACJAXJ_003795 [Colwellia sp.]|jgi:hypothetical protein|tara:strand:+ start:31341 stop:31865 length:525 start_codon:yes stop_codon:yes gene_type:complete